MLRQIDDNRFINPSFIREIFTESGDNNGEDCWFVTIKFHRGEEWISDPIDSSEEAEKMLRLLVHKLNS